jgi:predicted alpha/beta superfamily hydrolase
VDIHYIESRHLETTRRITVLRPRRRHGEKADTFPVLYLNDGQNLFDDGRAFGGVSWNVQEAVNTLVRRHAIPSMIVVGIDHGDARRGREYLPVEDDRNPDARNPLGRKYAAFLTSEVMPFVEQHYPAARGAANTGVGGSSYGAVAALYTSLIHPGVFGRLLLESPSLYVGNAFLLRKARSATRWPSRIYLGVGTRETSRADWNEETVANVRTLEAILRARGFGPRRLKVVVEEGATHSERAWAGRLGEALGFLFRGPGTKTR